MAQLPPIKIKPTRFEVIDHRTDGQGRVFVAWPACIELSFQDGGQTLKVFITDAEKGKPTDATTT